MLQYVPHTKLVAYQVQEDTKQIDRNEEKVQSQLNGVSVYFFEEEIGEQ